MCLFFSFISCSDIAHLFGVEIFFYLVQLLFTQSSFRNELGDALTIFLSNMGVFALVLAQQVLDCGIHFSQLFNRLLNLVCISHHIINCEAKLVTQGLQ